MSTSAAHTNKFWTVHHNRSDWGVTLWRMGDKATSDVLTSPSDLDALAAPLPSGDAKKSPAAGSGEKKMDGKDGNDEGFEKLETLIELKGHSGRIRSVIWQGQDDSTRVVTLDDEAVRLWNIERGATRLAAKDATMAVHTSDLTAGCWDPLHTTIFASTSDRTVRIWDFRSGGKGEAQILDRCHEDVIRDVDYNPNKPYHIVTAGDDRRLRLWDLRKPSSPLKTLGSHSHWVTGAKFNRFHDQLILSAGTDSSVALWSIVSTSSAPLGELENPVNEKEGDKLIKTYDEHEDSVYSIAWSSSDAWIFASLSYDGRVVVNHVPPAEKYKILL